MKKFLFYIALFNLYSVPAKATVSLSIHQLDSTCGNVATISATAGDVLVAMTNSNATNVVGSISSVTFGSENLTEAVSGGAYNNLKSISNIETFSDLWYETNTAGGSHSFAVTGSNLGGLACEYFDLHSTLGVMTFDGAAGANNISSGTTALGGSVTTTGSNDVAVAALTTYYASPTSMAANAGFTFTQTEAGWGWADLLNHTGTLQPKFNLSTTEYTACGVTAAFKEASSVYTALPGVVR